MSSQPAAQISAEDREFQAWLEAEYRQLKADEDLIHNREIHEWILSRWEQDSPKMWAKLQRLGLTDKMAFYCQQQMWQMRDDLLEAGYPITDAREVAERETLMLEPETEEPDDSDLPFALQDVPQNLKDRYREQMAQLNELEEPELTPTD